MLVRRKGFVLEVDETEDQFQSWLNSRLGEDVLRLGLDTSRDRHLAGNRDVLLWLVGVMGLRHLLFLLFAVLDELRVRVMGR